MNNPDLPDVLLASCRDADGRIVTLTRQTPFKEEMENEGWPAMSTSDPGLHVFTQHVPNEADALKRSDSGLVRVVEDLIDVLINRGVFQFTDLPDAVQVKLMVRRQTRASLSNRLPPLFLDDDKGLL
jgi:hypothetical protein